MIPKEPVYLLTAAVERVKNTIPDQDADDWLKDAIAADHIEWAYIVWKEDKGRNFQSFIYILPSAVIIEAPDLKIDWPKGTVTVHDRRGFRGHPALRSISGPPGRRLGTDVEYHIVVSRRDLDRELANIARLGMAGSEVINDERPELKQEVEPQEKPQATPEAQTAQGSEPLSEIERDLKDRAQAVLEEGKNIQNRNKGRLSTRAIALIMVRTTDGGKPEGWGEDTLRKILAGRYEPVFRLGLKGLDQG